MTAADAVSRRRSTAARFERTRDRRRRRAEAPAAPLNCVAADAGRGRGESMTPAAERRDRETEAVLSRPHRCHAACMDRCAARHSAAPLRGPARRAPAASGRPWPSPLSGALRSHTLGVLPRDCRRRLRPRSMPCSASTQRLRPCALAAPMQVHCPHPRIARSVRALWIGSRARSRGTRRPCDITRDYAHTSCVYRRGMRPPWRMKARACVIRRYVTWPPARPCACQGAALPARRCLARPARAARVCAPSLACCSVAARRVARGVSAAAPASLQPRARTS